MFDITVPTYQEFIKTVSNIEHLIHQSQAEIGVNIIRHFYPYLVEVHYFTGYFQIHIFTTQGLLNLQNTVDTLLLLPF